MGEASFYGRVGSVEVYMLAGIKFLAATVMGAALTILPAAAENGRDVMDRVYKQSDVFSQSEAEVRLLVVDKSCLLYTSPSPRD